MVGMRGLFYRFSIAAFIFGATVGAVDQSILRDQFNTVIVDNEIDSRLNAYIPLFNEAQSMTEHRFVSSRSVRQFSEKWVSKSEAGELKPILPGYFGENILEGPKGELIRTQISLAKKMHRFASDEFNSGNYKQAVEDAVLTLLLFQDLRGPFSTTSEIIIAYMRPTMEILNNALPKAKDVSEKTRLRVKSLMQKQSMLQCQKELSRQQVQYVARYGLPDAVAVAKSMSSIIEQPSAHRFADTESKFEQTALACGFVKASY